MISLDQVSFGYGGRETLAGLSADIPAGSFHFLTGPSGAGKTTLLKMLYLEHLPQDGRLSLLGLDPAGLGQREITRLRRRIGVVFQDFRLLDHLSVAENIALPLRVAGKRPEDHAADVSDLLNWVGLTHRMDALPPQISAGEKQRAAIARAVINAPDLILADEPTGNVDPEMGNRILRLLIELNRLGKTVVVATHDMRLIRAAKGAVQARILRLTQGQLMLGGSEL
ncbi:MAG: ATP-binding cassette domain-containing protein [Pseudomonadota bacterium]